jgi:hypothetical protein
VADRKSDRYPARLTILTQTKCPDPFEFTHQERQMPEYRGIKTTNAKLLTASASKWKTLALYRTLVNDSGLLALCETAKQLREVHIASDIVSDGSMPGLCSLPNLRSLLLDGVPKVTDVGIACIAKAEQLRELYLKGTQLTDNGVESFVSLPFIWSLALDATQITDAGVSQLSQMDELKIVSLRNTHVFGRALSDVPFVEHASLYLDDCPIEDGAIEDLVLAHPGIERLWLAGTRVTDMVLPKIASLKGLSNLNLSRTRITDRGIEYLVGHPTLISLYVEETSVSHETAERLRAKAPTDLCLYD